MEEAMSAADYMFHARHNNICIIAMIGFKIKIDPDVIKQGLRDSLLKHPRFTSIVVKDAKKGDKMLWKQVEINLENHVIVPNIEHNMDSPDLHVENYVSDLTRNTMDLSKPLWELHIINVKTVEADSIAVLKVHHSLGDGASLISLLLASSRKTSDPTALPTFPKKKAISNESLQPGRIKIFFYNIWFAIILILNTIADMWLFLATLLFLKDTQSPLKSDHGVEENPKKFVCRTISLDDMKLVKNAMNATINDVALGMIQAGLSRYLHRKHEDLINKKGKKRTKLRLRAVIAFNTRPTTGTEAIGDTMESSLKVKRGNVTGYVILPFNISLQDDPLNYVRQAKGTMDRKKHSLEALCTFSSTAATLKLFGAKVAGFITNRVWLNTTFSMSNVVGPQEEISLYGHPIAYIAPSIYGHPQALTVFLQGYANKMTIVLAADQSVISDPHQLCDYLVDSFELIKTAALEK